MLPVLTGAFFYTCSKYLCREDCKKYLITLRNHSANSLNRWLNDCGKQVADMIKYPLPSYRLPGQLTIAVNSIVVLPPDPL